MSSSAFAFDQIQTQTRSLDHSSETCLTRLESIVKNYRKHLPPDALTDEIAAGLKKEFVRVLEFQRGNKHSQELIGSMRDQLINADANLAKLIETHYSARAEKTLPAVSKDRRFISFENLIRRVQSGENEGEVSSSRSAAVEEPGEDEEFTMGDAPKVYKDPMTQREIVDPVRNKHCEHVYERETIRAHIKQVKQQRKDEGRSVLLKCPYMGCKNKKELAEGDLVEDEELKMKLEKMQGRKRKA